MHFLKNPEKSFIFKKDDFYKKSFLFFIRKILRVEPGRAFTHVHRG